jgi:catechol 2,3-dioxygenase-like lactoylglutathione lyase family enzyme
MKRFHVHVAVGDLQQSIRFYSTLFAAKPTVLKPDYAKWMLEDPRVNFAISRRGSASGIEHLGIQVEDETELAEVYDRLNRAERPVLNEVAATCCYAKSDKQWISDPQGISWETFLTHGEATAYGHERPHAGGAEAPCCKPLSAEAPCCTPDERSAAMAGADVSCCGAAAE